jgi:hypothetical protein
MKHACIVKGMEGPVAGFLWLNEGDRNGRLLLRSVVSLSE